MEPRILRRKKKRAYHAVAGYHVNGIGRDVHQHQPKKNKGLEVVNNGEVLEERPYPCIYCTKRFRLKFTLKAHLRTHTGERPYKCQQCPLTFTQCGPLSYHVKKVHGQGKFQCLQCKVVYNLEEQLKKHQKKMGHQGNWEGMGGDKGTGGMRKTKNRQLLKEPPKETGGLDESQYLDDHVEYEFEYSEELDKEKEVVVVEDEEVDDEEPIEGINVASAAIIVVKTAAITLNGRGLASNGVSEGKEEKGEAEKGGEPEVIVLSSDDEEEGEKEAEGARLKPESLKGTEQPVAEPVEKKLENRGGMKEVRMDDKVWEVPEELMEIFDEFDGDDDETEEEIRTDSGLGSKTGSAGVIEQEVDKLPEEIGNNQNEEIRKENVVINEVSKSETENKEKVIKDEGMPKLERAIKSPPPAANIDPEPFQRRSSRIVRSKAANNNDHLSPPPPVLHAADPKIPSESGTPTKTPSFSPSSKSPLFCVPCQKSFGNKGALAFHTKKKHAPTRFNSKCKPPPTPAAVPEKPPSPIPPAVEETTPPPSTTASTEETTSPPPPKTVATANSIETDPDPSSSSLHGYKCVLCDFRTPERDFLTMHARMTHPSVYTHTCPKCWKRFPTKHHLNQHVKNNHN